MNRALRCTPLFALVFAGLGETPAVALNEATHELINHQAARYSEFNDMLTRRLGFLRGFQEPLRGQDVLEWLRVGGRREDDGLRFLRHFHDPLLPWDAAGLQTPLPFESSIRWTQQTDQEWAWSRARDRYYAGLTSRVTSGETRLQQEQELADTFRTLGQVMHLVVDASVPEHTRNDIHPLGSLYGSYEYWAEVQHGRRESAAESTFIRDYLDQPFGFDATMLRQATGDAVARVPVARLIDTDTYTGADPSVTLRPAIGIAEFANANFFSEDTASRKLLGRNYPFPSLDLLEPSTHPAPLTGRARAYLKKQTDPTSGRAADGGLPVDPVLAECALDEGARRDGVLEPRTIACMDENVWTATALEMLPRAVSYARGVLDYFFRGQIEIAPPDRFVYARAPFTAGNAGAFSTLRFKVRNTTPGEIAGAGTIVAVVQYRISPSNLFEEPLAPLSEIRFTAVSEPRDIVLTETFQEVSFDFRGQPLPTNSADLFLTVVYRGTLGLEADAVAVGGKDIPEPDPVVVINATDYDCFAGQPYFVAGLPPAARDLNGDGLPDLFGPHHERGVLVKVDLANVRTTPSAQRFDLHIPEMTGGQYSQFVLLQDQFGYDVGVFTDELLDTSTGQIRRRFLRFFRLGGIFNMLGLDFNGEIVRQTSFVPLQFRGLRFLHGIATTTSTGSSCFPQTFTLPPTVTAVPGELAPE
ncbi:MAG TPA: hypothetical protein VLG10_15760 [Methylomirabilota bacterium]|nr:hypothetical protein [Methylomirabilota bacterium]